MLRKHPSPALLAAAAVGLVLSAATPALAQDSDGDGVPDVDDLCLGTMAGDVVDADGCSIAQLCPCEGPEPGVPWNNHGQYVSCVTQAANEFKAAGLITGKQKGQIVSAAAASSCGHDPGEVMDEGKDEDSPGQISLSGSSASEFFPRFGTLTFAVEGAVLGADPSRVSMDINGVVVPTDQISIVGNTLVVDYAFADGANEVLLIAPDDAGLAMWFEETLWAGSATLIVTVLNEAGQPVPDVPVTAELVDDEVEESAVTDANGTVAFTNVPGRTVILSAVDADGHLGTASQIGGMGNVTLVLKGFFPPSQIDNNDFSQGLDGWEVGGAPVFLVPHENVPLEEDLDLVLNTSGEGPQSVGRAFPIMEGTQAITVRYKFITSEVPGGYCGTQYNDTFSVSIRSQGTGALRSTSSSMNALGCDAFNASGATAWFELSLPVSEAGDVVQIDATVANVGDGLFDSQIVIDLVEEERLAIIDMTLNDIDDMGLAFLSSSAHTYYAGNTRVHGTIRVEGAEDDELTSLELEVLQGGAVVAVGDLAAGVQGTLLQVFGNDETVEVAASELLFELPSAQLSGINSAANGRLALRVRAESANGEEATMDAAGTVEILRRYAGADRFGGRDTGDCIGTGGYPCGGDDWTLPSVEPVISHYAVAANDFSNMNGGPFPIHDTHRNGRHVDVTFAGYAARDAATAMALVDFLNDPAFGSRIQRMLVTFAPGGDFANAIAGITLADGRLATNVITNFADHTGHTHWVIHP